MASLNKMLLIGNLTRDPELRYLPSGRAVCTIRIAASEKYKTASGEAKEDTLFLDVIVWGKQAENCSTYLKKGRSVFVEGRLRIRDYDARDGSRRRAVEVTASRVVFLGGPRDGRGSAAETVPDMTSDSVEEPLPGYEDSAGPDQPINPE